MLGVGAGPTNAVKVTAGGELTNADEHSPVGGVHATVTIGISRYISPINCPQRHSSILTQVAHDPATAELKVISPVSLLISAPVELPVEGIGLLYVYPEAKFTEFEAGFDEKDVAAQG